jgi:hypothetical protein
LAIPDAPDGGLPGAASPIGLRQNTNPTDVFARKFKIQSQWMLFRTKELVSAEVIKRQPDYPLLGGSER